MRMMNVFAAMAGVALAAFSGAAFAQAPGVASQATSSSTSSSATTLSAAKRAAIAQELIARWGSTVKAMPNSSVARWSSRLRAELAVADAGNVMRATTAPTFDLMHATLNGYVPTTADMQKSASNAIGNRASADEPVAPQALGDTIADLVYTPLPNGRCRIAVSSLPAMTVRNLLAVGVSNYTSQGGTGTHASGGSSAACGLPSFPTAYAVSITLLGPVGDGSFKAFAYAQPYQTGPGIIMNTGTYGVNNNMIVKGCVGCGFDLSIHSTVATNYIIDIVGYFMPPVATALQCVDTAETTTPVAVGEDANSTAPLCADGYTQTATNCKSSTWLMPFVFFSAGTCSGRNLSGSPATIKATRTCCRVPGR